MSDNNIHTFSLTLNDDEAALFRAAFDPMRDDAFEHMLRNMLIARASTELRMITERARMSRFPKMRGARYSTKAELRALNAKHAKLSKHAKSRDRIAELNAMARRAKFDAKRRVAKAMANGHITRIDEFKF